MRRQIAAAYARALMRAHFLPLRLKMCIVSSCSTFLGPYRMYVEHTLAVSRDGDFIYLFRTITILHTILGCAQIRPRNNNQEQQFRMRNTYYHSTKLDF